MLKINLITGLHAPVTAEIRDDAFVRLTGTVLASLPASLTKGEATYPKVSGSVKGDHVKKYISAGRPADWLWGFCRGTLRNEACHLIKQHNHSCQKASSALQTNDSSGYLISPILQ